MALLTKTPEIDPADVDPERFDVSEAEAVQTARAELEAVRSKRLNLQRRIEAKKKERRRLEQSDDMEAQLTARKLQDGLIELMTEHQALKERTEAKAEALREAEQEAAARLQEELAAVWRLLHQDALEAMQQLMKTLGALQGIRQHAERSNRRVENGARLKTPDTFIPTYIGRLGRGAESFTLRKMLKEAREQGYSVDE